MVPVIRALFPMLNEEQSYLHSMFTSAMNEVFQLFWPIQDDVDVLCSLIVLLALMK